MNRLQIGEPPRLDKYHGNVQAYLTDLTRWNLELVRALTNHSTDRDAPTGDTYTVDNVTTDRTFDANATTTDELADVLGTLITDLRDKGILK